MLIGMPIRRRLSFKSKGGSLKFVTSIKPDAASTEKSLKKSTPTKAVVITAWKIFSSTSSTV